MREKGLQQTLYPALGIVIFAVLLYTSLWFSIYRPAATVLMFGITVLFGRVPAGFTIYHGPFTPSADVDEIYTGRRREGIYAGAMTFSGKILRSIVVFSMGRS